MAEVFDASLTTIAINSLSKARLFLEREDDEYRWMWAAATTDGKMEKQRQRLLLLTD